MTTNKKKVYVHPELDVMLLNVTLLCYSNTEVSAGDLEEDVFEPLD